MATNANLVTSVVEKDIHCPFCNNNNGVMISQPAVKKKTVQFPEVGLRFVLLAVYWAFIQLLTQGFKLVETKEELRHTTYSFCPHCGNTFSMAAPDIIKQEIREPRLYRHREGKVASGLCMGIAELTGLSLLRVRLITLLYCTMIFPIFFYFIASVLTPFKEDVQTGDTPHKFCRIREGADMMGLCRGISQYTGISIWLVRLLMLVTGPFYFLIAICIPVKEDLEQGVQKKKLYKVREGKWLLGLCTGLSQYLGWKLWVVRLLTVLISLLLPPLYFVVGAFVSTKKTERINGEE